MALYVTMSIPIRSSMMMTAMGASLVQRRETTV